MDWRLVTDDRFGCLRLDPLPTEDELDGYYRSYLENAGKLGRAPDIQKQAGEEGAARAEREWLRATLWSDVLSCLQAHLPQRSHRRLLDVGCGTGEFVEYAQECGWEATGVEPSDELVNRFEHRKLFHGTITDFLRQNPHLVGYFDVATMLHVLEHVPDPLAVLETVRSLLHPNHGLVCIVVPNDFNILQCYIRERFGKPPWWVAIPDHLYYFNFKSLARLLREAHFDVLEETSDFPMEFFLLMGDDYVDQPEVGAECHRRRMNLELRLPTELRRSLYRRFAELELGRNCIVFARVQP